MTLELGQPPSELQGFGAFRVADLRLALPMAVLREVVPMRQLHPMPCDKPWVCGAIHVRGVAIPVVDLLTLLGRPAVKRAEDCIVLVAHNNRMVGLLASAVHNLFFAKADNIHRLYASDPLSALAVGALNNTGEHDQPFILDTERLMQLPGIPLVEDPEPHRSVTQTLESNPTDQPHAVGQAMLLLSNSGIEFAVDPSDIETTIARPALLPSDLASGYLKGVVEHRGRHIPAIHLTEFLGLKVQTKPLQQPQAIVLRYPEGALALLIDRIVDIVRVDPQAIIPLPPSTQLQAAVVSRLLQLDAQHFYVLNAQGFLNNPELKDLAAVIHRAEEERCDAAYQDTLAGASADTAEDQRVIVFDMNLLYAVPIQDVTEVLPYSRVINTFQPHQPLRGFVTQRGQAIPVHDLAQTLGMARQNLHAGSNVLVIEAAGQKVGYAVGDLKSIEIARWAPTVPVLGSARTERTGHERLQQQLVEVLIEGSLQLIECLSLTALAGHETPQPRLQSDPPQSQPASAPSVPSSNASCEWY